MSNATVSFLGKADNSGDDNALFLKVFSGEVLAAFQRRNKMLDMTMVRTISQGKSAQFPVTGTVSANYHTAGNEILGQQLYSLQSSNISRKYAILQWTNSLRSCNWESCHG